MAVSAFPALVDALVALAPGSVPAGTRVADALPADDDPSDFLAVGVQSLTDPESFAGETQQRWDGTGSGAARAEEGFITCIAAARSTDETVKDARDRAFAIAEGVASLCRSNKSLGVAQVLWTSYGTRTSAGPIWEEGQPVCYLVEFQVAYQARI
jgi:hypothetical protein